MIHDPFNLSEDAVLGAFSGVLDPAIMRPQLERLLGQSCELHQIRVTRLKPGRRAVLEYDLGAETLVGKLRAKGADRRTFDLQCALWHAGFNPERDPVTVPEPIGLIPELHLGLSRKVAGQTVTQVLETQAHQPGPLAERIVTGIRKLHDLELPIALPAHTIDTELGLLRQRLRRTADRHSHWAPQLERVMRGCERLAATLPPVRPRPIHRDFYADQVLIGPTETCLLDLDLCSFGDPALDLGNFIAHLCEHSLRHHGHPDRWQALETAIADRATRTSGIHPDALHAHVTLTLARHVSLSDELPGRQHITAALLALVETRLQRAAPSREAPPALEPA